MPVFPGLPEPSFRPIAKVEDDGYAMSEYHLLNHIGTHVDAPAHQIAGGDTLDEIPLDRLVTEALTIDGPGPRPPYRGRDRGAARRRPCRRHRPALLGQRTQLGDRGVLDRLELSRSGRRGGADRSRHLGDRLRRALRRSGRLDDVR